MDASNIEWLLGKIGAAKLKSNGIYVNATCPLATWRHPGGVDSKPGFGIRISPNGSSSYKCLSASCGIRGSDLKELIWAYQAHSDRDVSELLLFVTTHEKSDIGERLRAEKTWLPSPPVELGGVRISADQARRVLASATDLDKAIKDIQLVPDDEVQLWKVKVPPVIKSLAYEYLAKRTLEVADGKFWELGVAPRIPYRAKDGTHKFLRGWRIIFPVRDCKGQLVGWSARFIQTWCTCRAAVPQDRFVLLCTECKKQVDEVHKACPEHGEKTVDRVCPSCLRTPPPKFFHRQGFLRNLFLYGENRRVETVRRAILVEGFTDVQGLYRKGWRNVFGVMGSSLSPVHVEKLAQWVDEIITFPDGDAGGRAMAEQVEKAIRGRIPNRSVFPPDERDPGELSVEEASAVLGFGPDAALDEYRHAG